MTNLAETLKNLSETLNKIYLDTSIQMDAKINIMNNVSQSINNLTKSLVPQSSMQKSGPGSLFFSNFTRILSAKIS
jgi:flagellar hook-associated protein FlgK